MSEPQTFKTHVASPHGPPDSASTAKHRAALWLGGYGVVSWWLYVALWWLSRGFTYETPGPEHSLLPALAVLAALFGLYLLQVAYVVRSQNESAALPIVVVFAVAFRALLLFSEPIQEVDAYRYLWDGKVAAAGVNPFRYSPEMVLTANVSDASADDFHRLVKLRDASAANAEILARVHFGELTTVYPPVSQAVFALAACVTPNSATVQTHLLVMKCVIVAFDLGTIWLLVRLLQYVGRPAEWCVVYAWCPLVLKEFANSGHLDSIAVFFTTAAVLCAMHALYPRSCVVEPRATPWQPLSARSSLLLTTILLWLGVGAKIYPIILAPLLLLTACRRIGRANAVWSGVLLLVLTPLTIAPMLMRDRTPETRPGSSALEATPVPTMDIADVPRPPGRPRSQIDRNATGIGAFAAHWQMNDFLFLLLFENFKPTAVAVDLDFAADIHEPVSETDTPPIPSQESAEPVVVESDGHSIAEPTAWFVLTTDQWRHWFVEAMARHTSMPPRSVPFLAARLLTISAFAVVGLWLAFRGMSCETPDDWLRLAFLTIAWFWLLQPTQNPWYWIWALPLLPFARSRAWLVMSGLTLIYYSRFWFAYHAVSATVLGTPYTGVDFFDYVVTWIEYGPWLIWLMWLMWTSRRSTGRS